MSKVKGIKRVQISVYLTQEAYDTLSALSSVAHESVSDIIAKCAEGLAHKNEATAERIKTALQDFTIEY